MKMNVFWGILLVLLGISMVIPVGIPVFRIMFAVLLLYIGVKILIGGFGAENVTTKEDWDKKLGESNTIFNSRTMNYSNENKDYNIIFGSGTIDFRTWDPDDHNNIEVNIVFGECILIIDKDMPVKMKISSVFSGAKIPTNDVAVIGTKTFETESYSNSDDKLNINVNTVFGSFRLSQN